MQKTFKQLQQTSFIVKYVIQFKFYTNCTNYNDITLMD